MYLLYVDESGVTNPHPSQTTHYVMLGMAVHVGTWFALTRRVRDLKSRYAMDGDIESLELHAALMLRAYREQSLIPSFEDLGRRARFEAVIRWRQARRDQDWPAMTPKEVQREKKEFRKTEPYVHLTRIERETLYSKALRIVAEHRRGVVLFGEAVDKSHLPLLADAAEEAFSRLVDRFEIFLQNSPEKPWGIVVADHDQNQKDHYTGMLLRFQQRDHARGGVDRIIEAPFFLDSRSNSGVQAADLCAFALRRYLENGERQRFETILPKFYRIGGRLCGLRHLTAPGCNCLICSEPAAEPERRARPHHRRGRSTVPSLPSAERTPSPSHESP
jgi:Protein of unknown function (DUF3800)